jgi:hypothetical protein
MRRNFVLPGDWRTLRKYVRTTVRGLWLSDQRASVPESRWVDRNVEQLAVSEDGRLVWWGASDEGAEDRTGEFTSAEDSDEDAGEECAGDEDQESEPSFDDARVHFTVDQAGACLCTEGRSASRSAPYEWINTGELPVILDAFGRRRLDQDARTLLRCQLIERRRWKALEEYYVATGEVTQNNAPKGAAKKRLQRRRRDGTRVEDIARRLARDRKQDDGEGDSWVISGE